VDNHGLRYYDPEVGRYLTRDPIGYGDGMNVYLYVGDNPINHVDPHGLASTSVNWEPGQGHNDAPYRADYLSTTREEANDLIKFQPKRPESTYSIVQNRRGGSGEEKARAAAEHEKWADHWKSYPVTGPAVRAGEDIAVGDYGKAALNVGNALFDGWGAGGLERGGLRKALISEGKEWFAAEAGIHKNSLEYIGETHVYRVKGPDGATFKIGESAQGVRVTDGLSIRAEQQVRRLQRDTGETFSSEIRQTFGSKAEARGYERQLIERFRRMYGEDALPGNKSYH
jgi:hypothetical protein